MYWEIGKKKRTGEKEHPRQFRCIRLVLLMLYRHKSECTGLVIAHSATGIMEEFTVPSPKLTNCINYLIP